MADDTKLYTTGELQESKKPSSNIHHNGSLPLTGREKTEIIVAGRAFTVVASIFTFGLYYLYYLFCLEQQKESPFNAPVDKKYTYDRPEEADPALQEAQSINRRLTALASGKTHQENPLGLLRSVLKRHLMRGWIMVSVAASNLLTGLENLIMGLCGQTTSRAKETVPAAEETSEALKPTLEKRMDRMMAEHAEFELEKTLAVGLTEAEETPRRDYYISFVFYVSYILVSLLTWGILPLYHLIIKRRWGDFRRVNGHREHSCRRQFNEIVGNLLSVRGHIEYSALLLNKKSLPLNLNFCCDAFRTKVFRIRSIRRAIITCLMTVTLGLFGTSILSRNVFHEGGLSISHSDSTPTDYSSIENKWDRFKVFLMDLFRDISVANRIAAHRIATINNSISDLFQPTKDEDRFIVRLIRFCWSPLYFWLFSIVFFLSTVTFMIVYGSWYPDFYTHFLFWAMACFFGSYVVLFTKHINLLFI